MMDKKRVVGIDAGGTKTEFLLCSGEGVVYKRTFRGTGNPNDTGVEACVDMLIDGISVLCGSEAPDAVFAGISGAGSGDNAKRIKEALCAAYPSTVVEVCTDATNLLASGRSDGDSAALICGTGTALFLQKDGEMHRIGGWGNLFDRGGSAYDLGRDAIRATLAAEEKLIPDGALTRRVREILGADAHVALTDIYKKGKAYIASFARKAVECAESGDPTAVEIIDESISALCKRVAKAKEIYGDCPEIICGGGLFNSKYFFSRLEKALEDQGVSLYIPEHSQAFGACVRAAKLVGSINKRSFTENFDRSTVETV
jgi:N-acetylglucosamine kinase-like BadF-type ATPase